MSKRLNLTGQKFGRWIVLEFAFKKNGSYPYYKCKCECGTERNVLIYSLLKGISVSCGCWKREKMKKRRKHGLSGTRFYNIWNGIKNRCNNHKDPAYRNYGRRKINCDNWLKFEDFKNDMYLSYENHVKEFKENNTTIDRINNNGNYCKENCRWSTWTEQNNNKRDNILLTYKNRTQTIAQWSEETGIAWGTLDYRIKKNWSFKRIFSTSKMNKFHTLL